MVRLLSLVLLLLLSLLTIFSAPTNLLWYVSILVTEFSWMFFCITLVLLAVSLTKQRFKTINILIGIVAAVLFTIPVVQAYTLSKQVRTEVANNTLFTATNKGASPFSIGKMLSGYFAQPVPYQTITYNEARSLTMDVYPAQIKGVRPCVVVVHGGSWAAGDSQQLPELNSELARQGYHVATINYRLAPQYKFPAPLVDVQDAIRYLKNNAAALSIDTNKFVLLGRSAGGQIVLSAADFLRDPAIIGVISFYGPADMVWGYANPTNPLVLNSRKVMEDYLGGSYKKVPAQYIHSSATNTATRLTPPVLLIYGKNDPLVSYIHGERLTTKLQSVGAPYAALYMPWATHGFDWTLNGPGGQLSTWMIERFLESVVGSK